MALISLLTRLVNGVQRQVDLSVNTLVVQELRLNGIDLTTTAGSTGIGDDNTTYTNISPAAPNVRSALEAIDTALGTASGANTALSNLTSTAVNQSLIPGIDQAINLGAPTLRWLVGYISSLKDGTDVTSVDIEGHSLNDANGQVSVGFADGSFIGLYPNTGAGIGKRLRWYNFAQTFAVGFRAPNALAADLDFIWPLVDGTPGQFLQSNGSQILAFASAILPDGSVDFGANQSMGGFKITNAADPTASQDYVTKAYADALAAGLDPKASVRAATTAALPAVTYNNGASGVGATLTANANGALPAQDGTTLVNGNRLLVKNQAAALQNGIYVVTDVGSGGTPFILTRATDQDGSPANEVSGGNFVFVETGTLNSGAGWVVIWDGNITVGTDPMNWSQFSSITFIGGDMITITGNTISVDLATVSGLESTNPGNVAGQLRIKLEATNPTLQFTGSNELAAKLNAAGAIVTGASGLSVAVDNSSIEINSNALRVKALGITLGMLAANSVDENKIVSTTFSATGAITGGSGTKVAVAVDNSSIEINTNALRIKSTAYDQATITGGGGSAAAVAYAPATKEIFVAGETLATTTLWALRMAKAADSGFVAGRVYKADDDATTVDNFWVIGLAVTAGVAQGGNVLVTKTGAITVTGHGFTVGTPVYLGASGAVTNTAPSTSNLAVMKVGMVRDANTIEVQIGSPYIN